MPQNGSILYCFWGVLLEIEPHMEQLPGLRMPPLASVYPPSPPLMVQDHWGVMGTTTFVISTQPLSTQQHPGGGGF